MRRFELAALAAAISLLLGCAAAETNKPTSENLQSKTAIVLGVATKDVRISNVRNNQTNTFFVAATPKGRYECHVESGTLAMIGTLGIVSLTPNCDKQ